MPLYSHKCKTCGHSFDELSKFENRHEIKCPLCGGDTGIKITPHNPGMVWRDEMKVQTNLDVKPVYCETKADFKRELRKRGYDSPCLY